MSIETLRQYYPAARDARVLHSHIVRMNRATFSQRPGTAQDLRQPDTVLTADLVGQKIYIGEDAPEANMALTLSADTANRFWQGRSASPWPSLGGLRMAGRPWFLWAALGFMTEGRLWLDRALALDQEPSHERVWALGTAADIAVFQADDAAATALIDAVHDLAGRLEDPRGLAYATHLRGPRELWTDPSAAIPLLVEALERYACVDVPADYPNSLRPALTMRSGSDEIPGTYWRCLRERMDVTWTSSLRRAAAWSSGTSWPLLHST